MVDCIGEISPIIFVYTKIIKVVSLFWMHESLWVPRTLSITLILMDGEKATYLLRPT